MQRSSYAAPSIAEAPLGSRPLAVVLSGGGSYGSWQGGALYALSKKVKFHSVLGTSMGCINGAAYLQGDMELLKEFWRKTQRHKFLRFSPRLAPPSIYSHHAVRDYLTSLISETACRESRRCWFYVVSSDILNHEICQATYSPDPDGPWDSPLIDYILGSIAIPFFFPPCEIRPENGIRRRLLVDGHVESFTILKPLVDRGARDFLFLSVAGPELEGPPGYGPVAFIHTLIHQLLRAQVHNSMEAIWHIVPDLRLRFFEFNPLRRLSMSVLGFKKDECRRGFDNGQEDTAVFLARPEDFRL